MHTNKSKANQKVTERRQLVIPNQLFSSSFPREMKVRLNYFELQSFTGTAGIANDRVYNLNSIYDPYVTGTGHQPQGYDQWASFYGRYRVDACKAVVTFTGSTSGSGIIVTVLGNNDGAAINDPSVGAETPLAQTAHYAEGGPAVVLRKTFDLALITGVTPTVYKSDDRYQSNFGSSPSEIITLHVLTTDLNTAAVPMSYTVHLVYEVTMFDPIQLPLS